MKKTVSLVMAVSLLIVSCTLLAFAANAKPSSIDELDGKRLAVQTAVSYEDAVMDRLPNASWHYYTMPNDMILALESDKIDSYLIEEVGFAAQHFEHPELQRLSEPAGNIGFAIAIGNNEMQSVLLPQINEFIKKCDSDGTSEKMYDYWIVNWDPSVCKFEIPEFSGENGTIEVGIEGAYEPFSFVSDGKLSGFDVEFVCRFCTEYGYTPSFHEVPFESISPATESGRFHLGMNIVATDERSESCVLSDNYYACDIVFVIEGEEDVSVGFFRKMISNFEKTFIRENRWKMFVEGTITTILITLASILFGTALGFAVYMLCRHGNPAANKLTGFLTGMIEGMPTVVLLMILYYVVFGNSRLSGEWISIIGFTFIFACSMYDMLCVGCGAIPKGQIEASRALGYTDSQSFFKIILPQAARHFLPIYKNDMVSLIKETSVVGYIAVHDLTKISDLVRSRTYEAFFALIATALIYFIVEGIMSAVITNIQNRIDPKKRAQDKILAGITVEE